MTSVRPRVAAAVALATLVAGPAAGQQEPRDLLNYVPAPVNTVAVVNVAGILRSPRAEREGWAKLPHTEYLAGALPINPSIERILLATEFVPSRPGHGGGLAVAPVKTPIDVEKLAKNFGGEVTTVGGEKVVDTPDNRYFVPLAPQLLGAIKSDNGQDVARWLRYAKTPPTNSLQSLYLNRSVYGFGTRFHVLVAVDTEHLFTPAQLRTAVAESKVSQADPKTSDAITAFVAGMTGVRFTAHFTDKGIEATIRIDSNIPAANVPPDVMKGFVIETLAKNGAELTDLSAASARSEAGTVVLSFNVSDGELAKIMSLFITSAANITDADTIPVAPGGVTANGTKTYFRAIDRILADLRGQNENGKKYDTAAVWYDTAANKIATLSVLNVDPDAVKYGLSVAGRLQAMAGSLRGVPVEADALASKAYYYRFGGWFSWGGGGVNTNIPQINEAIAGAVVRDKANRDKLWMQIDAERGKARQMLAEKYSSDFERP